MVYPYKGRLLDKMNELLIHAKAWMNLKIIMLSERSQRVHTACLHLYKTLENANLPVMTGNQSVVVCGRRDAGRGKREGLKRGTRKLWGVHYLDCGHGYIYMPNFIRLHILSMWNLLYVIYT